MALRTAVVITASNRASAGVYADTSGEILAAGLTKLGYELKDPIVIPDNISQIQAAIELSLAGKVDLIVTTGGTGVSPHDVTPEATAPLINKLLPGKKTVSLTKCSTILTNFEIKKRKTISDFQI